jgi:hypothetical protein
MASRDPQANVTRSDLTPSKGGSQGDMWLQGLVRRLVMCGAKSPPNHDLAKDRKSRRLPLEALSRHPCLPLKGSS